MKNIIVSSRWGIQFALSILTVLGTLSRNDIATAQNIPQVSGFSQERGAVKDLQINPPIVPELIPENTLFKAEKVEDIAQENPTHQKQRRKIEKKQILILRLQLSEKY